MKQVIDTIFFCIPDCLFHPLLKLPAAHIAVGLLRFSPAHHLENRTAAEYAFVRFFIFKHADQHVGMLQNAGYLRCGPFDIGAQLFDCLSQLVDFPDVNPGQCKTVLPGALTHFVHETADRIGYNLSDHEDSEYTQNNRNQNRAQQHAADRIVKGQQVILPGHTDQDPLLLFKRCIIIIYVQLFDTGIPAGPVGGAEFTDPLLLIIRIFQIFVALKILIIEIAGGCDRSDDVLTCLADSQGVADLKAALRPVGAQYLFDPSDSHLQSEYAHNTAILQNNGGRVCNNRNIFRTQPKRFAQIRKIQPFSGLCLIFHCGIKRFFIVIGAAVIRSYVKPKIPEGIQRNPVFIGKRRKPPFQKQGRIILIITSARIRITNIKPGLRIFRTVLRGRTV